MSRQETIPFLDLKQPSRALAEEFQQVFAKAVQNGQFIGGPEVNAFEQEFAAFCRTEHAVGVGSGTEALRLALMAMGIGPGDEVITVPNTFIATTEAISHVGAKFVFVDVDPRTQNMDPNKLEEAITERTRCLIPVHLYGRPAEMDEILAIAQKHGIRVLEDAAQAQGSHYKGRPSGSMGDAGAFSFYPGKNLGALGEAGAVVTQDAELADRMRMLRDHGQKEKYRHVIEGTNGRLDAIQAGALRIKLRRLNDWNEKRRTIASWYSEALAGIEGIRLPTRDPKLIENYHLYVIHTLGSRSLAISAPGTGHSHRAPLPDPPPLAALLSIPGPPSGRFSGRRITGQNPAFPPHVSGTGERASAKSG